MKRAQFFVLLLLQGHILLSQNLVINPGFETWSKINKPGGWTHTENCSKDSISVLSGAYSCLHSGGLTTTSDLGQNIAVSAGKEYTLSVNYKTAITASGNGSRIWCYWKDESGISISDPATDAIMRPSKYVKSNVWEQFSITVLAPVNAVLFYLEVRTYPNSIAHWDDFVFEETITTNISDTEVNAIRVYPNPVSKYVIINNLQNLQSIDIQSLTGVVVWSGKFKGEHEVSISISSLPDGIYLIRIKSNGEMYIRRIVKRSND